MGAGMEETYQITSALKYVDFGKHVAVITDARFSGVSTGACIGHVTPEALAGGTIGKIQEGDIIEIAIDRVKLEGSVNLISNGSVEEGSRVLAMRPLRSDLAPDPALPPETRLWAALQDASGGSFLSTAVVLAVALVLGGLVMLTLRRQADRPVLAAQPEAAASPRPEAVRSQLRRP